MYQFVNPEPEVIFQDNFNGTTETPTMLWNTDSSTTVEDGLLVLQGLAMSTETIPSENFIMDFKLTPNFSETEATEVYLRAQDEENGYVLKLAYSEGLIYLFRKQAGVLSQIGEPTEYYFESGRDYLFRLALQANNLRVAVDNQTVLAATDNSNAFPAPGHVAFHQQDGGMSTVDDVRISSQIPDSWIIKGRVTSESSGWSLSGVTVSATTKPSGSEEPAEYAGITDAEGNYAIAVESTSTTTTLSVRGDAEYYSSKVVDEIELSPSVTERTVDMPLGDTAFISGTVADAAGNPVEGASVTAFDPNDVDSQVAAKSDIYGYFTLSALNAPGSYALTIAADGYTTTSTPQLEVSPQSGASAGTVSLVPAGSVSGRVVDAYGNPIAGAMVEATIPGDDSWGRSTTTTPDGLYTLENLDAPSTYSLNAISEGYEESFIESVSVNPGTEVEGQDLVLGLRQGYTSRNYGEHPGPEGYKDDFSGIYHGNANSSYNPNLDTHQWLTRQALYILQEDSASAYNKLITTADNHELWYWVARGARRADSKYWQLDGSEARKKNKDHFHHYSNHQGSYEPTTESAADFAHKAFEQAKVDWNEGKKSEAMYKLGAALHYVQDLRVPQHNSNRWPGHTRFPILYPASIEDYYLSQQSSWEARDASSSWKPGIYRDSFKRFGIHQNPDLAYGWVDRSAHVSKNYQLAAGLPRGAQWASTRPLFESAQRFSAGFLQFFFDEVNKPTFRPEQLRVSLTWVDPNHTYRDMEMHLHLLRSGAQMAYDDPGNAFPKFLYRYSQPYYSPSRSWGSAGSSLDDPSIYAPYGDDWDQSITIRRPSDGGYYTIIVHGEDDNEAGVATITVWLGNKVVIERSGYVDGLNAWKVLRINPITAHTVVIDDYYYLGHLDLISLDC